MGYPTEHSRDFPELAYLNLGSNPGTPFPLDVRLERTDTLDLAAPGPAKVVLSPAEAAPFPMTIPLAVEGGTLSTDKATLERGRPRSAEFTVTMNSAGETGAAVVIGPAPLVPEPMIGVHLVAADTLVLFTTSGDASDGEPDMAARLEEPAPGPLRSFSGVASAVKRIRRDSRLKWVSTTTPFVDPGVRPGRDECPAVGCGSWRRNTLHPPQPPSPTPLLPPQANQTTFPTTTSVNPPVNPRTSSAANLPLPAPLRPTPRPLPAPHQPHPPDVAIRVPSWIVGSRFRPKWSCGAKVLTGSSRTGAAAITSRPSARSIGGPSADPERALGGACPPPEPSVCPTSGGGW